MPLPTLSGEFGVVAIRDLEFQPNGDAKLNLRLAADDSKYDRQAQQRTQANKKVFIDVTLWRQDAEAVAEMNLQPGQKITVSGPMYVREFQKQDGSQGQSVTLDAYAFGIRPRSVAQAGNQQNQQAPQQNQQAPQQNQQGGGYPNPWNNQPPQQNQQMPPQQGGGYQQAPQQAPAQGYPQQNQQMPPQQNQQAGGWPQGGNGEPPF